MEEEEGEEIQDWGFLNKHTETIVTQNELLLKDEALPKRSSKYFEQDGSHTQLSKLDHAREQMYFALSSIRGHHVKQKLQAVWMCDRALVPHAKGGFFKDMGRPCIYANKKKLQGLWISGIEAVYLVERGSLIMYEADSTFKDFINNDSQNFDYETLRQMSLSHLYSVAFKKSGDSDKYQVYALLKRLGYLVMDFKRLDAQEEYVIKPPETSIFTSFASFGSMSRRFARKFKMQWPIHYLTYTGVFQSLRIIPTYSARQLAPPLPVQSEYQLVFNVWKPSPGFSKKNPPCPDFQLGVLNTAEVPFPDLSIMQSTWNQLNTASSKPSVKLQKKGSKEETSSKKSSGKPPKQLTKKELRSQKKSQRESAMDPRLLNRNNYLRTKDSKLKLGSTGRSVVYAIVDHGIINFTTFSETEFKLESYTSELDGLEARRSHGIVWNERLDLT